MDPFRLGWILMVGTSAQWFYTPQHGRILMFGLPLLDPVLLAWVLHMNGSPWLDSLLLG